MGQEANWHVQGPSAPREVQISHSWNVEEDLQEYRGLCWYSYRLQAPKEWEGRRVRIRFEAVYRDAVVWLNGQRIGSHRHSGYTVFKLDLTAAIRYGEDHLCAPIHKLHQSTMEQRLAVEVAIFRSGDRLWSGTYEFPNHTADRLPISSIRLDLVDLWHFDHPHLYEINVKMHGNGESFDEVSTTERISSRWMPAASSTM